MRSLMLATLALGLVAAGAARAHADDTLRCQVVEIDATSSSKPAIDPDLKDLAHARGIGYQTLIRMWVMERLTMEGAGAPTIPPRQQAG